MDKKELASTAAGATTAVVATKATLFAVGFTKAGVAAGSLAGYL